MPRRLPTVRTPTNARQRAPRSGAIPERRT
jgi:hypothetical protein